MRRRGRLAALVGALLLGLPVGTAAADEADAAAAAVRAAHEAGDEAALRDLAARSNPDPWRVADALLAGRAPEAARAFAAAGPREETRALPGYVETWTPRDGEAELRARLAEADRTADAGERARVLEAISTGRDDVFEVLLHLARGYAHRGRSDLLVAAAAFERGAEVAERLGWWAAQADGYYRAASCLYDLGAYDDALAAFRKRLSVETRLGDRVGIGRARFGLGVTLLQLARDAAAQRHMAEARRIAEEANDHEYLAKLVGTEGMILARQGKYDEARARFEEASRHLGRVGEVALARRFVASPARIADARVTNLMNAASMAGQARRWDAFERLNREAVEVAEQFGDARLLLATSGRTAGTRGVLYQARGELLAAAEAYAEAREAYERLQDRVTAADYGRRAASVRVDLGDYVAAVEELKEAARAIEETGAKRKLPRVLLEMGVALTQLGEFERAHERYLTALDLTDELDLPLVRLDVLLNLAEHFLARGDLAQSLRLLRHVEALELPEGVSRHEGSHAITLGYIRLKLGDPEQALELFERAEALLEEADDRRRLALARLAIARVWIRRGEAGKARDILQAVRADQRARGDVPGMLATEVLLGELARREGKAAEAQRCFEEVIEVGSARQMPGHVARARERLARVLLARGEPDGAHAQLERARRTAEVLQEPDLLAACYGGLALAHLAGGDADASRAWARRAVEQLLFVGRDLAEGEGAARRAAFAHVHTTGARAAARAGDAEDLYFFLEHGRAVLLLDTLGGARRVREAVLPKDARHKEDVARSAEARAFAALRHARREGTLAKVRDARARLDASRKGLREVVQEIQRTTKLAASAVLPTPTALATMRASLKPHEALVLYGLTGHRPLALVIHPTGERVVSLGAARDLRGEIEALLDDESPFLVPAEAAALTQRLITALALPEDVERILISPEGDLARIPFGLIAPDHEVVLVPSATTYAWLAGRSRARGERVLAFGAPEYGTTLARDETVAVLRSGADRLTPLPATADEARAIGDVVRLGDEATETQLRKDVAGGRRWRAVHLACHGLVDYDNPSLSCLALTADEANNGLLTMYDVFRLRVPTDLAVLSGCETGRGAVTRGEGLFGLPRAFLQAGASSVLVSLWPVDDAATQAFMTAFYGAWNPRGDETPKSAAAAVRVAQAHVRGHEDWSHPRHWAGWVLWGVSD